jgi:hypothetical protein
MSLTFREEALILASMAPGSGQVSTEALVESVQRLANAACKAWGHQSSANSDHRRCIRCGTLLP